MPRDRSRSSVSASEAASSLGISLDTLRRWDREGRIETQRDSANRRRVPRSELERLRPRAAGSTSARNRLAGTIREVKVEGLLAQVEVEVTGPVRVVAVITREAVEQLGLAPGQHATALIKSTSVMVER